MLKTHWIRIARRTDRYSFTHYLLGVLDPPPIDIAFVPLTAEYCRVYIRPAPYSYPVNVPSPKVEILEYFFLSGAARGYNTRTRYERPFLLRRTFKSQHAGGRRSLLLVPMMRTRSRLPPFLLLDQVLTTQWSHRMRYHDTQLSLSLSPSDLTFG